MNSEELTPAKWIFVCWVIYHVVTGLPLRVSHPFPVFQNQPSQKSPFLGGQDLIKSAQCPVNSLMCNPFQTQAAGRSYTFNRRMKSTKNYPLKGKDPPAFVSEVFLGSLNQMSWLCHITPFCLSKRCHPCRVEHWVPTNPWAGSMVMCWETGSWELGEGGNGREDRGWS